MIGERFDSWLRGNGVLVDALTASVLAVASVLFGLFIRADGAYFLLSLLLLAPLVLRRTHPVLCAAAVLSVAFGQWLTVRDTTGALPADLAVPMAVYAAAAYGPRWAGWAGLTAGLGGAGLGGLSWPQLPVPAAQHLVTAAFLGSVVLAAGALGALRRVRLAQADQQARIAVLAERTRIAREMHDIVAHSLAVVIAQADGGRYAVTSSPEAGLSALKTIGDHARQALGETRRALGVLRDDPGLPGVPEPPQPGLDDLPALVERVRAGGLDVGFAYTAPSSPVGLGLGPVVYRIVQEGLTNVIKHAGTAARAEVTVRWGLRQLEIDVLDDGAVQAEPSGGYGIAGMRERAGAHGGTVTAAPRPEGGWAVRARIPVSS